MAEDGGLRSRVQAALARAKEPLSVSDLTAVIRKSDATVTRSAVLAVLHGEADGALEVDEEGRWSAPRGSGSASPVGRSKGSKQVVVDDLCKLLDLSRVKLGNGSTEPKELLEASARALGVSLRDGSTKLDIAMQIVEAAGLPWRGTYDSTATESGGGGTITTEGLTGVLEAARVLVSRPQPDPHTDALPTPSDVKKEPSARNPTWVTDELILALDLYQREGKLEPSSTQVVELAEVLNLLPIHEELARMRNFRNPTGVAMKLANFAALDPSHAGKGMAHGSQGDRDVWDRYHDQPEELRSVAAQIRSLASKADRSILISVDGEDEVVEGRLLFRLHRARERDAALARRKKEEVLERTGRLACEGCGFDFAQTYGGRGEGYIEVHHLLPLSRSGPRATKLSDLAVLCANCHRMIHRKEPWLDLVTLRAVIAAG